MTDKLRHTWADTALGRFLVAVSEAGLVHVSVHPQDAEERLRAWAERHVPGVQLHEDRRGLSQVCEEFSAWAEGGVRSFSTPLDLRGTRFQLSCWEEIGQIPFGGLVTYRELARRMGRAGSFRAVGQAARANPLPIVVPCHRVVSVNGLGGFSGGHNLKCRLLEHEGALLPLGV